MKHAAVLLLLLGACSVRSIDATSQELINACKEITDEALRVNCLERVARETKDDDK